jgi:hypothetical protein
MTLPKRLCQHGELTFILSFYWAVTKGAFIEPLYEINVTQLNNLRKTSQQLPS